MIDLVDGKIQTCGSSQQIRPLSTNTSPTSSICLYESIIFDNESVVIKKQSRRVTTLEAKNALHPLIQSIQQEEISEEKTLNILPALNMKADPNNMWDVDRVKNYLSRIKSNKICGFICKDGLCIFFENSVKQVVFMVLMKSKEQGSL